MKKNEGVLMEATNMHIEIAKYLWQIKLQKIQTWIFKI